MNQFKQNGWTVQWEDNHEDYAKENSFIIIDKEMSQVIVKIEFKENGLNIKPGMLESVDVDVENKIITVRNLAFDIDENEVN